MRRRLAVGFVLFLLAAPAASADEAARIRVEPASFDFGRVLQRRTLRKEFRLLNLGDAPLEIAGISRSCLCTSADVGETSLPPGESTTLSLVLETRTAKGTIAQTVLVRSNDPQTPVLEVKVTATVVADETR